MACCLAILLAAGSFSRLHTALLLGWKHKAHYMCILLLPRSAGGNGTGTDIRRAGAVAALPPPVCRRYGDGKWSGNTESRADATSWVPHSQYRVGLSPANQPRVS